MSSNQEMVFQEMSTVITDPLIGRSTTIQKGIQAVLDEQGLYPQGGVQLECEKPKCTNFQTLTTCRICIRGRKFDSCKETRQHNGKCIKQQVCDACNLRMERCKWITKTYYTRCKEISLQKSCFDVKKIPLNVVQRVSYYEIISYIILIL